MSNQRKNQNFICIYQGHVCIKLPKVKFRCSNQWLGWLCTDNDNTNHDDANDARQTKYDGVGSFGIIPNEPKTTERGWYHKLSTLF